MGADHPDFFKTIIPGRTVMIEGQQQLFYYSAVYLNSGAGLSTVVYTVPAGKALYLWLVDACPRTGERINMTICNYGCIKELNLVDFGRIQSPFPAGAIWVFEAGDRLQIGLYNWNSTNIVIDLNVFGTIVDV